MSGKVVICRSGVGGPYRTRESSESSKMILRCSSWESSIGTVESNFTGSNLGEGFDEGLERCWMQVGSRVTVF